jgi:hypothetical protein
LQQRESKPAPSYATGCYHTFPSVQSNTKQPDLIHETCYIQSTTFLLFVEKSVNAKGAPMSSNEPDDLKNEVERLRAENASLKKGAARGNQSEGQRKGRRLRLWARAFSRDLI